MLWIPPGRAPSWYVPTLPETITSCVHVSMDAELPPLLADAAKTHTFVAHNALNFDAPACELLLGLTPEWYDTMHCARAAGLPGGLDALGEMLTGDGKDETGHKVMKMLCVAKERAGRLTYPVGTDAAWDALIRYNVQDVKLLETVYAETADYGEADVLTADTAINRRGVAVDLELSELLRSAWYQAEEEASAEVGRLTAGWIDTRNIRSVEQVKEWIRTEGIDLTSLDKNQVKRLIESPEELVGDVESDVLANVVEVLKLRQVATSSAPGKLASLGESIRGGRAVDLLVYSGAHTGRWSGRGFQPQNLGRGNADVDVEACLDVLDMLRPADGIPPPGDEVAGVLRNICPGVPLRDVLSTLTRPVFYAPPGKLLLIADYAAIEARGVAWMAGDVAALAPYREGRDPYCEMASSVFGRAISKADKLERHVGKTLVLGAGYGMSGTKYGIYAKQNGIDLADVGTTAAACVKAYRDRHQGIKRLWYRLGDACMDVVSGGSPQTVAGCYFHMRGRHFAIRLPSGRPIVYRDARVEMQVPVYCMMLGLPEVPKPTVVYTHPRGYRKSLYGGLLCENVVSGSSRDLLAVSLVQCGEELPVVLHVHDEIVAEVDEAGADEALQRLVDIMTDPPAWAEGFPVGVEGFVSPRYVKSPFEGFKSLKGESR